MRNVFSSVLTTLLFVGIGVVDAPAFDLQKLVTETQRMSFRDQRLTMVWWIPSEYWEAAFQANAAVTDEMARRFIQTVDDYSLFAVANVAVGPFGGMTPTSREALAKALTLHCSQEELKPLDDSALSPDLQKFLKMMKPMLTGALGQFGSGLEFMAFRGKTAEGDRLLDPRREGRFSVQLGSRLYHWRLPVGAFLPPKIDPVTGEEFPGNYNFNPFTGKPLETKAVEGDA